MTLKVAILIGLVLLYFGYRMGKRTTPPPPPAQVVLKPAAPRQPSWLSVRVLLVIVIVLLIIAILTSLQR